MTIFKAIKSVFGLMLKTHAASDVLSPKSSIIPPENDAEWQRLHSFIHSTFAHLPETPIEEIEEIEEINLDKIAEANPDAANGDVG